MPDGHAELEMRDDLNYWVRTPCGELETAPGSSWWIHGGVLPPGTETVEIVASGRSYEAETQGGLWLVAIPRAEAIGRTIATARRPDGTSLGPVDLTPAVLDPVPSVPRADLSPERAAVTLRAATRQRMKVALKRLVRFDLGPELWLALLPRRSLHLGFGGLTFFPLFRKRHFEWGEIGVFVPAQHGSMIGLVLCRRQGVHAELHGELYDVASDQLAALLMAWRNH